MTPDEQTVLHLHRREHDGAPGDIVMKALGPWEIKDATLGIVEAWVATLDSVDHDREVILSGAIPVGSKVKLSYYGHDVILKREPPVGKGTLVQRGDQVFLQSQYFLSTTRGREAFETVKALGSDGEWSLGFKVLAESPLTPEWKEKGATRLLKSLNPVECSPVFEGASLGTMTIGVKEADEAAQKAKADADAARVAADEAEARRLADEIEQKARVTEAMADHDRIQRYLRKVGVV